MKVSEKTKFTIQHLQKLLKYLNFLTLPFPSLLTPTLFTKGGRTDPASYLKNRCPHERDILQGIRDTFDSLRNVKVIYIMVTWLP